MVTRGIIVLLHHLYHCIALLIHFDKVEANLPLGKLAHLVLNLEAIRTAIWVAVAAVLADIFAVTWRVGDMESHFYAILCPREFESLVEATLDIFRHVTTASRLLHVDFGLD